MTERKNCELCGTPNVEHLYAHVPPKPFDEVRCQVCGTFRITEDGVRLTETIERYKTKKYVLSGLMRARSKDKQPILLDNETIDALLDSVGIPKSLIESVDRLLWHIYQNTTDLADGVEFNLDEDYPLAFARNTGEFQFFINKARDIGYIESVSGHHRITLDGWKHIEELQKTRLNTNRAFVAMWFNPEYNAIWENGFKPALEACGYSPVRIDFVEHIDKTDDKIIAEIRRSSLLVADFTGSRGGVYFEAGFAMGLGIPVIWTCEKKYFDQNKDTALHFDTRQFNHILWENVGDLVERLKNRINAVIRV